MRLHSLSALILGLLVGGPAPAQNPPVPEKKYEPFDQFIAGAKVHEGLIKLYQKDEHLYAELLPNQLDKPFLAPIALARGGGIGGLTLNFDEQWVIVFKRSGDKVFLVRRNVRYQAKRDLPVGRAVETSYTDSILFALPIRTINPMRQSVVIDFADIFLTNFADMKEFGMLDRSRTTWHKVKVFPRNVELQVAATFAGRGNVDGVIDSRGNTIIVHYSLLELPDNQYQARQADDRVGHFLTAIKDFSNDSRDTSYLRYINRWRLDRVDGSPWKEGAKLVPPKKKIVFWIERSVPDEYRAAVREGILEWNKAFEKIGFRDAIEVRQQESEDFDPEDVNYNTFRWITSDLGFAMGPSRANPFTGEIFDADIIFDASMIRYYKIEQQLYKNDRGLLEEPASLIQASRNMMGVPLSPLLRSSGSWNDRPLAKEDADQLARISAIRQGLCQCAAHKHNELHLALMTLAARANLKPGDKLSDEMIQQAIKETAMHEVGHTLGLRHNFKASTMLKNEDLHNTEITRKQGLVGSVMDYSPVNLAPKGVKQGDFFTTTLGPYDYWVIEYAYKPIAGGSEAEQAELKKIASRSAQAGLDYGTDEDLMTSNDPNVNVWDLGSDPMKYAQARMALSEELLKGLAERVVENGEGYQRARQAFSILLGQYGDGAYLTAKFVGGEILNRDHKGDPNARDPQVPVKPAKQREALAFLQKHILTDVPFNFSPELLRKLAAERWLHWGSELQLMRGTDYPIHQRILAIQRIVLRELLDASTLTRMQNLALKTEPNDSPLMMAEVFRAITESVWIDLPGGDKGANGKSSIIRRNLQREHLKELSNLILRTGAPPDARSLARMHLRDISIRIDRALKDKNVSGDDTVRAHLQESYEQISKVLGAGIQVQTP